VIVTLLTDYGLRDEFVGVCHAVIRGICPDAAIVDLTHGVPRHSTRWGAITLHHALPYLPAGIHMAVVDPEVGTERRAVALRCADGRLLVGPDTGLLSLAWETAGGVEEAVDVSRSRHRLEPVSATFHGRDVFAPVTGSLAAGEPLADAGEPLDPEELARLELPRARREGNALIAHVLGVDAYGNVALNAGHAELAGTDLTLGSEVEVEVAAGRERVIARVVGTFADVATGELLVYEDAHHLLALALNRGSAAAVLGVGLDDEVRLSPR
jgi:S-adenosylmethionine hydrolase